MAEAALELRLRLRSARQYVILIRYSCPHPTALTCPHSAGDRWLSGFSRIMCLTFFILSDVAEPRIQITIPVILAQFLGEVQPVEAFRQISVLKLFQRLLFFSMRVSDTDRTQDPRAQLTSSHIYSEC